MIYLEYLLGAIGIVIGIAILIAIFLVMSIVWAVLWTTGLPIRVTDAGGKTLGHYRWFTFYKSEKL